MAGTPSFTERAPHEAGFAEVFRREIVPVLERHEAERVALAAKARQWMLGAGAVGAALVIGLTAAGVWNLAIFAGGLAALFAFGAKATYEKRWRTGLSSEVMPIACRFLGDLEHGRLAIQPSRFREVGLVPSHSRAEMEDSVIGAHAGLSFAMTEAHLTDRRTGSKGKTRTVTVFRGILMRIELATEAPSIFFARDHGKLGNWFADTFSSFRRDRARIEVDDPEFEATYETYAKDEAEARAFITPRLTQGLMEVARTETGRDYVAAALAGKNLYLALPRSGDFLALGRLFTPLAVAEEEFHRMLADLTLPRRVIDALRGEGGGG